MPDADKLTPADPSDLAGALAYALRYQSGKRVHNADEIMAEIGAASLGPGLRSLTPLFSIAPARPAACEPYHCAKSRYQAKHDEMSLKGSFRHVIRQRVPSLARRPRAGPIGAR